MVGPGLSTFYLPDSATSVAGLVTFFGAISNKFPPGITWTIPGEADQIDPGSGTLTGATAMTGGGTAVSTGTDTRYAAGVGARIVWGTASVAGGRRIKGSTFLVPLEGYCYAGDGTLDATNASQMLTAVTNLLAAMPLQVWHRPQPGGGAGFNVDVTSGTIPDKVSTLRSRRT